MSEHINEFILDRNKSRAVDECNDIVCFERAVSSNEIVYSVSRTCSLFKCFVRWGVTEY